MAVITKNTLITIDEVESPYNVMLQVSGGNVKIYAGADGLVSPSDETDLEVLMPQFRGISEMKSVPKYLYFETDNTDVTIYLQGVILA